MGAGRGIRWDAAGVKRIRTVGGLLSPGLFVSLWTDGLSACPCLVGDGNQILVLVQRRNLGWLARTTCPFSPSNLQMRMSFLVLNQRHLPRRHEMDMENEIRQLSVSES